MGKSYRNDSDYGRKFMNYRKSAKKKNSKTTNGVDKYNNLGYAVPGNDEIEPEWDRGE